MKRSLRFFLSFCAIGLAAVLSGCGPAGPQLAPTSGTVTLNGQPVDGAGVTFMSSEDPSAVGSGTTDAQGNFTITTGGKPGAPVGKCKIGIAKVGSGSQALSPDEAKKMTMQVTDPTKMTKADKKSQLPAKYASPGGSGLTEDVVSGKDNRFTIKLEGQAP